jgi:DNA-binding PadR family transcriptional regulator
VEVPFHHAAHKGVSPGGCFAQWAVPPLNKKFVGGVNRLKLSAGTLYGNLSRLEGGGLIAESNRRPDLGLDDERRRYYRLTEFGRAVAVAEAERMEQALVQARAKKLFRKPKLA